MAPVEELKRKFAGRDVEFLLVYVREAHPEERGYRWVKQPQTLEQKWAHARRLVEDRGMTVTVLIDGMDETVHREFGRLPNMVYVIDKDGRIVYKSTWTQAKRLGQVLTALTEEVSSSVA